MLGAAAATSSWASLFQPVAVPWVACLSWFLKWTLANQVPTVWRVLLSLAIFIEHQARSPSTITSVLTRGSLLSPSALNGRCSFCLCRYRGQNTCLPTRVAEESWVLVLTDIRLAGRLTSSFIQLLIVFSPMRKYFGNSPETKALVIDLYRGARRATCMSFGFALRDRAVDKHP